MPLAAPRKKLDSEFSEEENKLEMADTQAEIILSQGLPRHIFNNLNQTSTAKEIWDNVEMLMQGSDYSAQHSNSSDEHQVCQQPSGLLGKVVLQSSFHPPTTTPDFPPTQVRNYGHDGHIVTEPVQRKLPGNKWENRYIEARRVNVTTEEYKDMLAMQYVDEGPNVAVAFMANLSSTSATNNPVNEDTPMTIKSLKMWIPVESGDAPGRKHLRLRAETEIETIRSRIDQYLLDIRSPKCSN
ncbi:hypothetical protein Tco_0454992 [Tanacetum coccineum]